MDGSELEILYLEDNPMDVEALEAFLEEEGMSSSVLAASDRKTFCTEFEAGQFDAVFLDYAIPGYNGSEALEYVRSRGFEKPVIIISGTIGDERAVELIKKGASDYVLKQNISKLVPALKHALKDYDNLVERRDFSRRLKEANEQLQEKNLELGRLNSKLKDLDRMKSEFISLASHEMRTPLTGILGYAETLLADDLNLAEEEKRGILDVVARESRKLSRILDSILEISRIQGKMYEMSFDDFDIVELADETVEKLDVPSGIDFSVPSKESGYLLVHGDRERIGGVLFSLLRNALKHTLEGGSVRVEFKRSGGEVVVSVEDTGAGIPEKDLERVFDEFYRVDGLLGVSGLELSVSRSIVELHGGRMWVRSSLNGGVAFYFSLPGGGHF